MNVLLVGGCGYIGYHLVRLLKKFGHNVIVIDYMAKEDPFNKFFDKSIHVHNVSFFNINSVQKILKKERIELIIQAAGHSLVPESIVYPIKYFMNNASGNVLLLEAAALEGVKKFIYISSAAVFGNSEHAHVKEQSIKQPMSPLGSSQLFVENALEGFRVANEISYAVLRAPNLIGLNYLDCDLFKDNYGANLLKNIFDCALNKRPSVEIYGKCFKTVDKTCEREYLHVDDFCDAVIRTIPGLEVRHSKQIYNIGLGRSHSVKEMITICENICSRQINLIYGSPRAGDPFKCIFDSNLAHTALEWRPLHDSVEHIIKDMWNLIKK